MAAQIMLLVLITNAAVIIPNSSHQMFVTNIQNYADKYPFIFILCNHVMVMFINNGDAIPC